MCSTFEMNVERNYFVCPAPDGMNNAIIGVVVIVYTVAHCVKMWDVYVHVLFF